jgi:hypothetical protein
MPVPSLSLARPSPGPDRPGRRWKRRCDEKSQLCPQDDKDGGASAGQIPLTIPPHEDHANAPSSSPRKRPRTTKATGVRVAFRFRDALAQSLPASNWRREETRGEEAGGARGRHYLTHPAGVQMRTHRHGRRPVCLRRSRARPSEVTTRARPVATHALALLGPSVARNRHATRRPSRFSPAHDLGSARNTGGQVTLPQQSVAKICLPVDRRRGGKGARRGCRQSIARDLPGSTRHTDRALSVWIYFPNSFVQKRPAYCDRTADCDRTAVRSTLAVAIDVSHHDRPG